MPLVPADVIKNCKSTVESHLRKYCGCINCRFPRWSVLLVSFMGDVTGVVFAVPATSGLFDPRGAIGGLD